MKKKIIITVSCFLVLVAILLLLYGGAIFQRGNPIPYVGKMFMLSDSNRYSRVFENQGVYIARVGNNAELIKHIESSYSVVFKEQLGSAYMFKSDEESLVYDYIAEIEVYWRYYMVWEIFTLEHE